MSNPCNILDQQTAGTFLQSEAQDKYNFFMKATDLDTIEKDLDRLSALIPRTKQSLDDSEMKEKTLKLKVETYEEKLNQLQGLKDDEAEIKQQKVQACLG